MSHENEEFTGKDVDYYLVEVKEPKRLAPYTAECEDIIEALGMTFAEGCEFKALWRSCAARTLGKHKKGSDKNGVYDAEKQVYYANRTLSKRLKDKKQIEMNVSCVEVGLDIPLVFGTMLTEKVPLEPADLLVKVVPMQPALRKFPEGVLCANSFRDHLCGCTTLLHLECHKTFSDCIKFGNESRFNAFSLDEVQSRG